MNINPAHLSKINWANAVSGVVALAAVFGFAIPTEYQTLAVQVLAVATPVLTIVLRSFFTAKP